MPCQSAFSCGAPTPELVGACIAELGAVSCPHGVGVVYLSDAIADDASGIVEALRRHTGIECWVGGTGIGACGTGRDAFATPALSVLILDLPAGSWRAFGPWQQSQELSQLDGSQWSQRADGRPCLGLVHADPRHSATPALIEQLAANSDRCFVVGGLLSSRGACPQVAERVGEGAVSGLLLSPDNPVLVRLSQGCSPIGPRRRVTRAEQNVVYELEGERALDALTADAGLTRVDASALADVHVALPRVGSDTADYQVRNLLGIDPASGALVVAEALREGQPLMFCRRDATTAREDLERMLEQVSGALREAPKAAIYVSCLARGPNLFDEPGLEARLVRDYLGEVPLAGFFANGELCGGRLYGYTGVLTLLL